MWCVAVSAVAVTLFGCGYKVATIIKAQRSVVNAVMMVVSAGLAGIVVVARGELELISPASAFGCAAGISLYIATATFFQVMRYGRLSIQWTVISMSVAVPVVVAVVLWGERPTGLIVAGLTLAAIAMVLMGIDKGTTAHRDESSDHGYNPMKGAKQRSKWIILISIAFITTGLSQVCTKALIQYGLADCKSAYVFVCFAVAAMPAVAFLILCRVRPRLGDVVLGSFMAVCNILATWFLLCGLETMPAVVMFPLRSVVVIVLTTGLSVAVWRESIRWAGLLGICTAGAAICCLSYG